MEKYVVFGLCWFIKSSEQGRKTAPRDASSCVKMGFCRTYRLLRCDDMKGGSENDGKVGARVVWQLRYRV
jgi:hypothetical protein